MRPSTFAPVLENGAIAAAAVTLGLMAVFFWIYAINVAPALTQVDAAIYAQVQSLLNRNVRHAGFFALFFGAGVAPLVALLVNVRHRRSAPFWLLAVAGLLYIGGVVVYTRQVNLPHNAVTEAWNPAAPPADWMATRDAWNRADALRAVMALLAFVASLSALLLRAASARERDR